MKLSELKALAKAAAVLDHNETEGWYVATVIESQGVYFQKNARFIAAASPQTILAMIALIRQLGDALESDNFGLVPKKTEAAIKAFKEFDK